MVSSLGRGHNDGLRVGGCCHQLSLAGLLAGVIVRHRHLGARRQRGRPRGDVRGVGQEGGRRPIGGDEAVLARGGQQVGWQ